MSLYYASLNKYRSNQADALADAGRGLCPLITDNIYNPNPPYMFPRGDNLRPGGDHPDGTAVDPG